MRKLAAAAPALAGAWAAANGWLYAADAARRYRAESAWLIFATVLLVAAAYAIARAPQRATAPQSSDDRAWLINLPVVLIGAVLLYAPMLSIGLLSDDFVLLARAQSGSLVDRSWEFVRPLPLALWRVANAPAALHALNIGLHGLNAWLTAILASRFGLPRLAAVFAGLVFLSFPTSVEPVAWAAGVFDVLMVTLILTACIALTAMAGGIARTLVIAALTAAALATKETAIVTPFILIIAGLGASARMQSVMLPVAVSIGIAAVYVAIRAMAGFSTTPPSQAASGYVIKEFLSRPYATLGLPFHLELLQSHPWIPYVFALLWPLLFALSAMQWRADRATVTRILSCAAWILVSTLPLATMLFIADDLQGSRYLYLGSAAFSIMLLALVANLDQSVQMLVAIPLVALFAVATRSHQSAWTAAALERDRVLNAYRDSGLTCSPGDARGLPDHVRGAYVFRNGFAEAARTAAPGISSTPCRLGWDGRRFVVEQ